MTRTSRCFESENSKKSQKKKKSKPVKSNSTSESDPILRAENKLENEGKGHAAFQQMDPSQTRLAKRSKSQIDLVSGQKKQKKSEMINLGNSLSIWGGLLRTHFCQRPGDCALMRRVQCHYHDIWEKGLKHKSKDSQQFAEFVTYQPAEVGQLKTELVGIGKDIFDFSSSKFVFNFILNPGIFLRKFHFVDLSWSERLIALFYLVKKNAFLAPVQCFCDDRVLMFIRKKSTKRKHELIRFCMKKYLALIIDACVAEQSQNLIISKKKKVFFEMLDECIPGTQSKDLIKTYFNENKRTSTGKRKRVKNIKGMILKLRNNPVTRNYFQEEVLEKNFFKIYQLYYPERKAKVKKFIERFQGKPLVDVFFESRLQLVNKRLKLFFNHEDIKAGYNHISAILNKAL